MTQDKASPARVKRRRTFDGVSAKGVRQVTDHLALSERDSRKLQKLLEHPPAANAKLRAVATDLP